MIPNKRFPSYKIRKNRKTGLWAVYVWIVHWYFLDTQWASRDEALAYVDQMIEQEHAGCR